MLVPVVRVGGVTVTFVQIVVVITVAYLLVPAAVTVGVGMLVVGDVNIV